MSDEGSGPWAGLPAQEALRRVRQTVSPRWEAWIVLTFDQQLIWCARRRADSALAHGDTPARLLAHIADADDKLLHEPERNWP